MWTLSKQAASQFDNFSGEEKRRIEMMLQSSTFYVITGARRYYVGLNDLWVFVKNGKTRHSVEILFFERGWWKSQTA